MDGYDYPNRARQETICTQKQKKRVIFGEMYGAMEMIDIILGDDD